MKYYKYCSFLFAGLIVLSFLFSVNKVFANTEIRHEGPGYIYYVSKDTTWTKEGSPYVIYSDVRVDPGVTLTIEPGTIIKIDRWRYLNIYGKLIAKGTANKKIYFTSLYNDDDSVLGDTDGDEGLYLPEDSTWEGIEVYEGGSYEINNAEISYVYTGLTSYGGSGFLNFLNIFSCNYGVYLIQSNFSMKNSVISNIKRSAVVADLNSVALVDYSDIKNIIGRGFDVWNGSSLTFLNSNLENIGAAGFFGKDGASVNIDNSIMKKLGGNYGSFQFSEKSSANISNSVIEDVETLFQIYNDSSLNVSNVSAKDINGTYLTEVFNNSSVKMVDFRAENVIDGSWAAIPIFNDSSISIVRSSLNNITAEAVFQAFNRSSITFSDSSLNNIHITNDSYEPAAFVVSGGDEKYASSTLDIVNSEIGNGNTFGMLIYGKVEANIKNTKISNFLKTGIRAFSNPIIRISDSEISGNENGIQSWGADIEIKNSVIKDNTIFGIYNNSTVLPIKATGNWWGDASGPYNEVTNTSGLANIVSRNVLYSPWLTSDPNEKKECCSNVVFIPGLKGSRLYKKGLFSENQLWEPNRNADVEKLYMDSNGNSIDQSVYNRDVIERTNVGLGIFDKDIYKKFFDTMDGLVDSKKINGWEALPYDWRLDINKIVKNGVKMENGDILNFVYEIIKNARSSATGKVTIVTHSNGGLVSKVLIDELKARGKEDLIDKLILVASPQLGTPEAIVGLLHGDGSDIAKGIILDKSTARKMGENMMGAYNLLPEDGYFFDVVSPIIKFDSSVSKVNYPTRQSSNFRTKYGDVIDSASELRDFLLGNDGRSEPEDTDTNTPNVLKTNLLNLAKANHDNIDSWTPPANIKVIQLAGWGVNTISGIEYFGKDTCAPGFQSCVPAVSLDRRPIYTEDGDKTVVTPSAVAMSGEEKYYLNLPKEKNDFELKIEHSNILESSSSIQFVTNLVLNENQDISKYITVEKPISTNKTLELALHSPVSINVYDNEGNHTGLVDNPNPNSDFQIVEENIPGSRYDDFGEGKYVLLDGDTQYSVKLQGLDFGTFTLETEKRQGGVEIATSSFIDILTSPTMTGEVVVNSSTANPIINIDVDGDGKNDFIISGNQEFDPIVYLQILRKTVETFSSSKKTKDEVIKKIDSIIKSLQKDKTKSAISKIKALSNDLTIKTKNRQNKEDKKHSLDKDWKNKKHQLNKDDAEAILAMLNQLLDNLMK